jgi:C4-type Zn-finger protein
MVPVLTSQSYSGARQTPGGMPCPHCCHIHCKVIDSRFRRSDGVIYRRRKCSHCGYRFASIERVIDRDARCLPVAANPEGHNSIAA